MKYSETDNWPMQDEPCRYPNEHVFKLDPYGRELKFVGDFEGFYEKFEDPWQQSARDGGPMSAYYKHSRAVVMETLVHYEVQSVIEVGCGHGHLTARLTDYIPHTLGMDVSFAAVQEARRQHPHVMFCLGNILDRDFTLTRGLESVLWSQCLWYLLHELDQAVENSVGMLRDGGYLVISQAFLRDQKYGRHIVDGFAGCIRTFNERYSSRLRLVRAVLDDSRRFPHDDGILVYRYLGESVPAPE